jgi:hypothetical protein
VTLSKKAQKLSALFAALQFVENRIARKLLAGTTSPARGFPVAVTNRE